MPQAPDVNSEKGKERLPVLVLRLGSHPAVFSIVTVLGIGALLFFLVVVPSVRAMQAGGTASIADATAKKDAAIAALEADHRLVSAYAALTPEERGLIAYALPGEEDIAGASVQVSSLVSAAGGSVAGIDATKPDDKQAAGLPPNTKPVNIAFTAQKIDYERLKMLLANLENNLRLFDLRSLNYTPSGGVVSLELRTYFLKK